MGEVSPTLQLALSTIFKTRFENHLSDKNTQSHFPLPTLAGVQTPPRNAPSHFMQTFYSLNCHGEKSCKTTRPSVSKLSWRTQCGHLGFCHYERSEVIQKQVLIASRLPRRAFCTSRNDKIRIVMAKFKYKPPTGRTCSKEIVVKVT